MVADVRHTRAGSGWGAMAIANKNQSRSDKPTTDFLDPEPQEVLSPKDYIDEVDVTDVLDEDSDTDIT